MVASLWKQALSFLLKANGGKFILQCNLNIADLPNNLPKFYVEYFTVWAKFSTKPILTKELQVLSKLVIWNNQFMRIGEKPFFVRNLIPKK